MSVPVVFLDGENCDGYWYKRWDSLVEQAMTHKWSAGLGAKLVAGELWSEVGVGLVVVHNQGNAWTKLSEICREARKNGQSVPFRLRVSSECLTFRLEDEAWECEAGVAIPNDTDLSSLAARFSALRAALGKARSEGTQAAREAAWRVWQTGQSGSTEDQASPVPEEGGQRSTVGDEERSLLGEREVQHALLSLGILCRLWELVVLGEKGDRTRRRGTIEDPDWWRELLRKTPSTAGVSVESLEITLRARKAGLGAMPLDENRQKADRACDAVLALLESLKRGRLEQTRLEAARDAISRHLPELVGRI